MNDLTQYKQLRGKLRPGDVVVFWGAKSNPLSALIEWATGGGPSHTAIVRQGMVDTADVQITQSTLDDLGNGVRTDPLGAVLADYPAGSSAAALLLSDETRARINAHVFYAYLGSIDRIEHYDTRGLFAFLLPEAIGRREPSGTAVCSVCVAAVLSKCGAIEHVNWGRMRPQDVVELGIYSGWVPLLGNPKPHRFNTI